MQGVLILRAYKKQMSSLQQRLYELFNTIVPAQWPSVKVKQFSDVFIIKRID